MRQDQIPYAVDRVTDDRSIRILRTAEEKAKVGDREKLDAIQRLQKEFASGL